MTDEQAALCVQAYWRRYLAVIYYQESRGAAITMQARMPPPTLGSQMPQQMPQQVPLPRTMLSNPTQTLAQEHAARSAQAAVAAAMAAGAALAAGSPQPMMHADADPLDHLMLGEL